MCSRKKARSVSSLEKRNNQKENLTRFDSVLINGLTEGSLDR